MLKAVLFTSLWKKVANLTKYTNVLTDVTDVTDKYELCKTPIDDKLLADLSNTVNNLMATQKVLTCYHCSALLLVQSGTGCHFTLASLPKPTSSTDIFG